MPEVSLKKSIPLSIIIGLLIQTGGFIWYFSALNSRVGMNEEYRRESKESIEAIKQMLPSIQNHTMELKERKEWMVKREDFETDITRQMIRMTMSVDQFVKSTDELKAEVRHLKSK